MFSVGLHQKDLSILEDIQAYFGGIGRILKQGEESVQYTVSSKEELKVILAHFSNYPLITKKRADFELFKRIVEIMQTNGQNKTIEGIQKIVSIRASLNNGLSEALKEAFPNTIPVLKPLIVNQEIPAPE